MPIDISDEQWTYETFDELLEFMLKVNGGVMRKMGGGVTDERVRLLARLIWAKDHVPADRAEVFGEWLFGVMFAHLPTPSAIEIVEEAEEWTKP